MLLCIRIQRLSLASFHRQHRRRTSFLQALITAVCLHLADAPAKAYFAFLIDSEVVLSALAPKNARRPATSYY